MLLGAVAQVYGLVSPASKFVNLFKKQLSLVMQLQGVAGMLS